MSVKATRILKGELRILQGMAASPAFVGEQIEQGVEPLPGHIWKEDFLLLPLANTVLGHNEQKSRYPRFEQFEGKTGSETHYGFERLAKGIEVTAHPLCI